MKPAPGRPPPGKAVMQNPLTHPIFRSKILKALRMLGALLALAALYVALVGISIDASSHDKDIAGKLSAALGREVRFTGPMQLEISAWPKLRLGGLHVANARGFGGGEFASLGEAKLALDLWPLLRGNLQIEELSGSDVHLRLQVRKDGNSNWTFNKEVPAAEEPASSGTEAGHLLSLLDIQRVSLQKLDVEYIGSDGKSHYFNLNSLVARIPSGQPVSLTLNGSVEKNVPY